MWLSHWNLAVDPFGAHGPRYVSLPSHEEVVSRMRHLALSGERLVELRAEPGLGKSAILREVAHRLASPTRRVVSLSEPADPFSMLEGLAEGLGLPTGGDSRERLWRRVAECCRVLRRLGHGLVVAIDDDRWLAEESWTARLASLDPHPDRRLTILVAGAAGDESIDAAPGCLLELRLEPLTRSEAERLISRRLAAAGRAEPTFTPRAWVALHGHAGGVPSFLTRIGRTALIGGAAGGLEIIGPDLVDAAARECQRLPGLPVRLF